MVGTGLGCAAFWSVVFDFEDMKEEGVRIWRYGNMEGGGSEVWYMAEWAMCGGVGRAVRFFWELGCGADFLCLCAACRRNIWRIGMQLL